MAMSKSEAGKLGYLKIKKIFQEKIEQQKQEARKKYEENKKFCLNCNAEIQYEDRAKNFCNSSCSATFNNRKRKTIKYCLFCDKLLNLKLKTQKYCSRSCQRSFEKKFRYEAFAAGEINMPQSAVRKFMIEKYGTKCMECDWDKVNPYSNKCPIELEHIDGNSQNNKLNNLKLLCPNCHSLTSTYKALNAGKGRHKRRQRYKEGKSY